MLDAHRLVSWSGIALAAAGLLYVPLPFIPSWTRIEDIGTPNWWVAYNLATIHHFFLLFGLFGVFVAQLHEAGRFGVVAFVLASLGNALVGGVGIVQLTILPVFAANPDVQPMLICTPFYTAATNAAEGFIATACAAWSFDVLATWAGISWLTLVLGSTLLGIAIALARVLPRWAGLLLALGWLYSGVGFVLPIPEAVGSLGIAVVGAGYVACGWHLWARKRGA
jgi:hypothetical protein